MTPTIQTAQSAAERGEASAADMALLTSPGRDAYIAARESEPVKRLRPLRNLIGYGETA